MTCRGGSTKPDLQILAEVPRVGVALAKPPSLCSAGQAAAVSVRLRVPRSLPGGASWCRTRWHRPQPGPGGMRVPPRTDPLGIAGKAGGDPSLASCVTQLAPGQPRCALIEGNSEIIGAGSERGSLARPNLSCLPRGEMHVRALQIMRCLCGDCSCSAPDKSPLFSCLFCPCPSCLCSGEPRILEHALSCRSRQSAVPKILLGCSGAGGSAGLEHCRHPCSSAGTSAALQASLQLCPPLLIPLGKRLLPLPDSSLLPRERKIHLFSMAQLGVF